MEKKLSEITRAEWITFDWLEITTFGDQDRNFRRSFKRTPDEAARAQIDWDETEEARKEADKE